MAADFAKDISICFKSLCYLVQETSIDENIQIFCNLSCYKVHNSVGGSRGLLPLILKENKVSFGGEFAPEGFRIFLTSNNKQNQVLNVHMTLLSLGDNTPRLPPC